MDKVDNKGINAEWWAAILGAGVVLVGGAAKCVSVIFGSHRRSVLLEAKIDTLCERMDAMEEQAAQRARGQTEIMTILNRIDARLGDHP